jgi:hypothetical protein
MKKTAVDFLIEQFEITSEHPTIQKVIKQAKEMEKQQIIDACKATDNTDFWVRYDSFEQYYKQTYNK